MAVHPRLVNFLDIMASDEETPAVNKNKRHRKDKRNVYHHSLTALLNSGSNSLGHR